MDDSRPRLGISACLLGENVRYDGGHKLDRFLRDTLGKFVDWVPVCPETECGLPVPRESMHLEGTPESPRLVTIRSRTDHTDRMIRWAEKRLKRLESESLCGFVFKSRSPSSGIRDIKIYSEKGHPIAKGSGVFAGLFMKKFPLLPVEDEGRLHDPALRENFIERLFVYRRWKDFLRESPSVKGWMDFHADHKLLIMAHSPAALKTLGQIVADADPSRFEAGVERYFRTLMPALGLIATPRKNTNVLHHVLGYFKKDLTPDEKQEMLETIGRYHQGFIPLIVPVTLLNHHVRKYRQPYLGRQHYLNPHPAELMLRNHV
ncbi:MAG TPA: DUF1722 domain-containing protein [bacterium]|nr:DUF1722 domain-containing protein [bacterium]